MRPKPTRIYRHAAVAALALALIVPTTVLAAGSLVTRTDSKFRLNPGTDKVSVVIDVSMTNRKAPTTSVGPCSPGSSQRCSFRTSYYFDRFNWIWVPTGATNVKVHNGVGKRLDKQTKHWKQYSVTFPNLNYQQTRKFRVTYDLQGGKPRSKHHTRVMDAYTYFCWHGEPGDTGKVTAQLPPGYDATVFGERSKLKKSKKGTTITGRFRGSPGAYYACVDAFKPSKLITSEVTAPGGQLVKLQGWPEDPEWAEAMTGAITDTLPQLEEMIGRPMPEDEVTVREVSKQSLEGYGSEFARRHKIIRIGEHLDDPAAVPGNLAMVWFSSRFIKDTWLGMGLGDWAGENIGSFGCWPAGTYPGKGEPKLRRWRQLKNKPTEQQEDVIVWQARAACDIVEDVADDIGEEAMHTVIASLLDDTPKYGSPDTPVDARQPSNWQDWLDAVDELGYMPAGETDLTKAEQALIDVGVATPKMVKGRAAARETYHQALAALDGTELPLVINDAMGRWDWKAMRKSLPLATETYEIIMANDQMSDADRTAFLGSYQKARSSKSLRSLRKQASEFVRSAELPVPDDKAAPV